MSDDSDTPRAGPSNLLALAGLVLLVLGAVWLFSGQQQALRKSPTGFDGLAIWLRDQGHASRTFTGGWPLDPRGIGLLVVPVYDTQPDAEQEQPIDKAGLIARQDETDIDLASLLDRARHAQTLLVLPKWRTGMRLTGLVHPALLNEADRLEALTSRLTGSGVGKIARIPRVGTSFDYRATDGRTLQAQLYAAQVFAGPGCEPLIGRPGRMILGRCETRYGHDVLILSDPDLLSNHGLMLGDNALIAADLLPALAAEEAAQRPPTDSPEADAQDIVIDYASANWVQPQPTRRVHERSWEDLARFFGPPFSVLWLGAGALLALVLWRAGRRFGPVRGEVTGLTASKRQAIAARARLMRMTGQDGAMLGDYVSARLAAVAATLLGPQHTGTATRETALLRHAARRDPALADALAEIVARIRALPDRLPAADAIHHIDRFEELLEQTAHDT